MTAEPTLTAVDGHDDGEVKCCCCARGWHHNKVIGGKLRWLGKYLP